MSAHISGKPKFLKNKSSFWNILLFLGTAHCADVYPPSNNDLPQLIAARKQIVEYIGKWLELWYFDLANIFHFK